MLNCVTLMGRLAADPVLKVTPSGKDVCSFNIAVDRAISKGEKKADFIPIVVWGSSAKFVCDYFGKGSMIALEGKIQIRAYTDNEGNKRSAFEVVAREVSFCGSKNEGKNTSAAEKETAKADKDCNGYFATATAADFEEIVDDEDLPF